MTMRKFLPLLATAAAAAALATGCVTNGAITTLDLTDTNGETLQSVSEWDPGESHTYSMPTLPDGCEVNIVSSDPSLLSAELSEGDADPHRRKHRQGHPHRRGGTGRQHLLQEL